MSIIKLAQLAKEASYEIMNANNTIKNNILISIIEALTSQIPAILNANTNDVEMAINANTNPSMIDRMSLNEARLLDIINSIKLVLNMEDPIGETKPFTIHDNGLLISQMRVSLGVIAMIYEARPNVSIDSAILAIKSGNAIILKGSKSIMHTNTLIVNIIRDAIKANKMNPNIVSLVADTSRASTLELMHQHQYIDVLIPRGSAALIQNCVQNSTIPLLETGSGNCHIYVDEQFDEKIVLPIIENAKTSRVSVCNACESLLIHQNVSDEFINKLITMLFMDGVIIHGDARLCQLNPAVILADEQDYAKEYLALEISIKCVADIDEAISHINKYSTHHSDVIISTNLNNQKRFLREVDSACVYVNASTRFSDGFEFNLGAEIGISTQKLHARGPMGLKALTTIKYVIEGNGQIRK